MVEVENDATTGTDNAALNESQQQADAAQMIQRNYRGYRERRQLKGIGLDASARWTEVRSTVLSVRVP
jgi:hypothetical protein